VYGVLWLWISWAISVVFSYFPLNRRWADIYLSWLAVWVKCVCVCGQFDGQRTPVSCRLFWKNAGHPAINTSKWTQDEDTRLLSLVVKYAGVNWEAMATELEVVTPLSTELTLWHPLLQYGYSYKASCARPGWAVICNFWHLGTLTLRAKCQSAQMSEITNDGLGCFIAVPIWQQWAWKVNVFITLMQPAGSASCGLSHCGHTHCLYNKCCRRAERHFSVFSDIRQSWIRACKLGMFHLSVIPISSNHMSLYMMQRLSVSLSICLSVHLSVCLSVCFCEKCYWVRVLNLVWHFEAVSETMQYQSG